MAISPPSDILLDVANAADPAKVRLAREKLAQLAAEPTATNADFGKALTAAGVAGKTFEGKNVGGQTFGSAVPRVTIGTAGTSGRPSPADPTQAYQKFEAVLLQNFVESMLPKNDELYGDKTSAGIYRSMMAEQFAAQLSKAGGIGIAAAIAAKHPAGTVSVPRTPAAEPAEA